MLYQLSYASAVRSRLADHVTDQGIGERRPAFVQYRRDGFFSKPIVPPLVRLIKKIEHRGIVGFMENLRPVGLISEELRKREDRV